MKIAIVGGGIAGLAAASDLQNHAEVTLFEASPKLGGKVQTAREGPYLIEQAPDATFTAKPWTVDLVKELGMEHELIEPLGSEFSILLSGKLHSVPRPLASFDVASPGALDRADFLSEQAKHRVLQEPTIPPADGNDESVASFFRRRFGAEFSVKIVEPLLAGTHAGDPEKLSVAALYPGYFAMEKTHGSIAKGIAARPPSGKVGFVTLKDGMGSLVRALELSLTRVNVRLSATVESIEVSGEGISVVAESGEELFDHVILAVPAYVAASLLDGVSAAAAERLAAIEYVSTAVATLAYPKTAFKEPLSGNGFLVPRSEPCAITGCTWSSNKWPGRAPEAEYLIRVFLGRAGSPDIDPLSDRDLITSATETLDSLFSPACASTFSRVDRWSKGLPQYTLGHLQRLQDIESALNGLPISLVGSSYRGNSISDCIRQGCEAARMLDG